MSEMDTTRLHTFALFFASLVCTLALTGCLGDELVGPYEEGDKIAFAFDLVAEAQAAGVPASMTVPEPVANPDTTIMLKTELIGKQRSSPVQVSYSTVGEKVNYVRETPADTGGVTRDTLVLARKTTASDANYDFPGGGSYQLPADSSSATFAVTVNEAIPSGGDPVRLAIKLDGNPGADLQPAERMRYFTINIVPTN